MVLVPESVKWPGPWTKLGQVTATGSSAVLRNDLVSDPWVVVTHRFGDPTKPLKMWVTLSRQFNGPPKFYPGIFWTESADGLNWVNPYTEADPWRYLVLRPVLGQEDGLGNETFSAIYSPGDSKWFGYYMGYPGQATTGRQNWIFQAESMDGIVWTKKGPILKPVNLWERTYFVDDPEVGITENGGLGETSPLVIDGRYHMWYAAFTQNAAYPRGWRIGLAQSGDSGISSWQRSSTDPVFDLGRKPAWDDGQVSHQCVVRDPGGWGYHLFYYGVPGPDTLGYKTGIGHAFSVDARVWERNPNNPILTMGPSSWDSENIGGPCALIYNNKWYMWYHGGTNPNFSNNNILLATAPYDTADRFENPLRADQRGAPLWPLAPELSGSTKIVIKVRP